MASPVTIDIDERDLRQLDERLKRINSLVAWRKVQRPAMQKAMRPVRASVKLGAGRFNKTNNERIRRGFKPGALVRGVRMRSRSPKKKDLVTTKLFGPALGDVLVGVYFGKSRLGRFKDLQKNPSLYHKRPPFYAQFLELGRRKGGAIPRSDFIRKEFDSRVSSTLRIYTSELKKRLDERTR